MFSYKQQQHFQQQCDGVIYIWIITYVSYKLSSMYTCIFLTCSPFLLILYSLMRSCYNKRICDYRQLLLSRKMRLIFSLFSIVSSIILLYNQIRLENDKWPKVHVGTLGAPENNKII